MWRIVRLLTGILGWIGVVSGQEVLRIGVQASSQSVVNSMYGPIFERKFAKLNYTVNSTALGTDAAIYAAIEAEGFDVFYGGPPIYNCLQSQYGLRGIAAGIDIEDSEETPYLGAQMVARTTSGIKNIAQMRGTRVALTQLTHTVGCLAQWGEMRKNGLDLFVDTKAVIIANTSQNVLNAIATGVADVGFLRAGTVEQQTQNGLYKDGVFQVVNELNVSFPWPVSTPLYPAILIAVSKSVSDDVSTRLAESLFEEDGLSLQANISRWVPLQDYVPIQSLQVQLGVMFGNLSQCYRVASYYDSIVCPAGYYKQDRTRLETSCTGILECPRDLYTCICGPCLKASSKNFKKWFAMVTIAPVLLFAWLLFVCLRRRRGMDSIDYSQLNVSKNWNGTKNKHGKVLLGRYKGSAVELKRIRVMSLSDEGTGWTGESCLYLTGRQTSSEIMLRRVRALTQLHHANVEQGVGATFKSGKVLLVTSNSSGGKLKDLLHNPTVELERGMVISLLYDIAKGLGYLESQEYVISAEDFDTESVALDENFRAIVRLDDVVEIGKPVTDRKQNENTLAFGKVMYDMVYRRQRLLSTVDQGVFTFQSYEMVNKESGSGVVDLLQDCLSEDAIARPSMNTVIDVLHRRSDRSFGDTLNPIKIRGILQQMLPVSVVNDIKMNRKPAPHKYEDVSMCIIDISHKTMKISGVTELREIGSSIRSICESITMRKCLMTVKALSEDTRFIAVGNLMSPLQNHMNVTMDFAIEAVQKISRVPMRNNEGFLRVQAGVHIGSVTSAIMGSEQARFSLLGPDVVLVSQLQLRSEPDHLLISTTAANRALLGRSQPYNFFTSSFGRTNGTTKVQDGVWLRASGSQSQIQSSKEITRYGLLNQRLEENGV